MCFHVAETAFSAALLPLVSRIFGRKYDSASELCVRLYTSPLSMQRYWTRKSRAELMFRSWSWCSFVAPCSNVDLTMKKVQPVQALAHAMS